MTSYLDKNTCLPFQVLNGVDEKKECSSRSIRVGFLYDKILFNEADSLPDWLTVIVNGEYVHGDLMTVPVKAGDEPYPIMVIEGG